MTHKRVIALLLILTVLVWEGRSESTSEVAKDSDEESLDDYLAGLADEMDDLNPMQDNAISGKKQKLTRQVDRELNDLQGSLGQINSFFDDEEIKKLVNTDPSTLDEDSKKVRQSLLDSKEELDAKIAELEASIAELEKLKEEADKYQPIEIPQASGDQQESVDSEEKSLN